MKETRLKLSRRRTSTSNQPLRRIHAHRSLFGGQSALLCLFQATASRIIHLDCLSLPLPIPLFPRHKPAVDTNHSVHPRGRCVSRPHVLPPPIVKSPWASYFAASRAAASRRAAAAAFPQALHSNVTASFWAMCFELYGKGGRHRFSVCALPQGLQYRSLTTMSWRHLVHLFRRRKT